MDNLAALTQVDAASQVQAKPGGHDLCALGRAILDKSKRLHPTQVRTGLEFDDHASNRLRCIHCSGSRQRCEAGNRGEQDAQGAASKTRSHSGIEN